MHLMVIFMYRVVPAQKYGRTNSSYAIVTYEKLESKPDNVNEWIPFQQ